MEGTCMFVWECIKSEGYHIGMCVDTFMFGSCCAHNITENTVLPQYVNKPTILYTPPSHHSHVTKRPTQNWTSTSRPKGTSKPHKPQTSYTPNKNTIRPLPPSISKTTSKPHYLTTQISGQSSGKPAGGDIYQISNNVLVDKKPGWQFTTDPGFVTQLNHNAIPSTKPAIPQWQFTTEPAFVTKTKTKPSSFKPKPTKKPFPLTTSKSTIKFSSKPAVLVTPPNIKGTTIYTTTTRPRVTTTMLPISSTTTWSQIDKTSTSEPSLTSTMSAGPSGFDAQGSLLTSQIRIRVGEYDFSSAQEELPYVERAVSRKIVHPKYNFFTYEYDLALVQLDKALDFAPHISPICLPASDDLLIGENATVTGWGRLSEGGSLPTVLQEVHVPIVSNENCKSMFLKAGRHEYIPDIFLCAGYEKGGQDSCQGDSGGPLQVRGKDGRYFLAGIISWGIGCAEANLPGVCTRISKFVPWILKNVT
ncbi:transmembrane protease serine [Holotrichia oblita]|uniref:Transmembrane protease serine n=1 Tax=Holotrichia oblita TaxID=644536 RepID=A0ACB9SXK2_HOLOL|nr:transmembrane protease serine [Holotrichia oblita]